jgi:hypothetical protein
VNKRIVMRMSDFQWPEVVRKETFPLVKKLKLQFRCHRMFHNLLFLYLFLQMLIKKNKTKTTDFGKMGLISHNPVINDLKRIRYMVGLRETNM